MRCRSKVSKLLCPAFEQLCLQAKGWSKEVEITGNNDFQRACACRRVCMNLKKMKFWMYEGKKLEHMWKATNTKCTCFRKGRIHKIRDARDTELIYMGGVSQGAIDQIQEAIDAGI